VRGQVPAPLRPRRRPGRHGPQAVRRPRDPRPPPGTGHLRDRPGGHRPPRRQLAVPGGAARRGGARRAPRPTGGVAMYFTWFNLMPWPYLANDFRERHRSIWVDIPNRLYDPEKGHHLYHRYMDQLEYAETLGFDGIGVNEHHQNGYGLMPSPNVIAGGLARRTSRAAICVIGNSIALYNPPIRVAEEFAMLDVI